MKKALTAFLVVAARPERHRLQGTPGALALYVVFVALSLPFAAIMWLA